MGQDSLAAASATERSGAAQEGQHLGTSAGALHAVARFGCGHPKSSGNIYGSGGRARCRACALVTSAAWNRDNRDRKLEIDRGYRQRSAAKIARSREKHRLAYRIYFHLRKLAIKDGLWPVRPRGRTNEGGTP